MSKNLFVCSKSSIQRFIKLWLSVKPTPYWFHQTLSLGQQIEDFAIAKPILEKLFDSLEVEMGKTYDMGAVYIMGHQGNKRVHFHVVFFFYGTPAETPEKLAEILRLEIRKRWKKLNPRSNPTGNWLKIQTKASGLWYLAGHLAVGKTAKAKGKPSWYGVRNKRLIEAHALPVTSNQVRREFECHFPAVLATPAAKKPKVIFYDRSKLAELRAYVEADGRHDWEDFKRMKMGRKRKVSDFDFMDFLNAQNGWKTVTPSPDDGNTL